MSRSKYTIFLFGLFVSAMGSNAFVLTIVNILKDNGAILGFLGLFVAVNRFTAFVTQMIFGKIGDQFSPRIVVFFSEVGAALSSVGILNCVDESGLALTSKTLFLFFGALRLFFVALQFSSIQKIAKHFDETFSLNGNPAIHLSLINNLALFVMGCVTFVFFKDLNLKMILIFDAVTFIFNGLSILMLPNIGSSSRQKSKLVLRFNFSEYYFNHRTLFFLDMALCFALFGANILNLKLLSNYIEWIPILTTSFGLAGVVASLSRFQSVKWYEKNYIWMVLAASVICQGLFVNQPVFVLFFSMCRNFSYWLLFNSVSKSFMAQSSTHDFASVSSSRQATVVGTLSLGEFLTGSFTLISLPIENLSRGFAALTPVFLRGKKSEII